jgi:Galactose oxidase, central domain
MPRHLSMAVSLTLGVLAFAACGEDTPTQPQTGVDPSLTAPLLATASNTWTPIAPMPGEDGAGPAVGVVPNSAGQSIAYVFGGTNGAGDNGAVTRIYNVATNTWSLANNRFDNQVGVFNSNGVGNIRDTLYLSGGYDYSGGSAEIQSLVWAYDPVTDKLIRKADMPLHTAGGVSGVIGDKLYVLPGTCSGDGWPYAGYCEHEPIRKLFRYNPATNIWVTKASAPHFHKNGVGGVIGNRFYVAGGQNDRFVATVNLDVYDPATNTWKSLASLPTALNGVVGAVLRGQLFVIGTSSGGSIRYYAYNPTSNKWNTKAVPSHYGGPAAKVFLNGTSRLLVLEGATEDNPDRSQIYTP